jgi:uncharacterized membrane protein
MQRTVGALALASAVLFSLPAHAGLKVCNQSNDAASVAWALGFTLGGQPNIYIWGWQNVSAGECQTLNNTPSPSDMVQIWYVYAKSINGHWASQPDAHTMTEAGGNGTWSPTANLCAPGENSPSTDDLQKPCDRLPYMLVSQHDSGGADYEADLLQ